MENRISDWQEPPRGEGPQPIGEILEELLAQYQVRCPEAHFVVVETPAAVF